jgi:hypothetical protein
MRLAALLLAARAASVAGQILPAARAFGADLVAYYAFDEGSGFDLKEAVTGQLDGKVLYEPAVQTVTYDQPNWQTDERFGTVISCGDAATMQRDTLELADVDYGKNGKFTMNVWFRHDKEDFPDLHKEVLFGHGDPGQSAGWSANHVHVWLEKGYPNNDKYIAIYKDYNTIRTLAGDSNDPPSYTCPYCESLGLSESDTEASTGATCGSNTNCWSERGQYVDTLASEHDPFEADHDWHMYTLTTHPDGAKGFSVYVDGNLVGSQPYNGKGVDSMDWQTRANFNSCYECPELAAEYLPAYQDRTTADACADDDTGMAALAAQQQLGTLPVPGACYAVGQLSQSPLTPYCQAFPSVMNLCCATCGALIGYNSSWTPVRGAAGASTADRELFARLGDPIDPIGPMRFCGRLAGFSQDTYTKATQGHWANTTTSSGIDIGWHKDRFFLGKVAHASFYSTAMSQTEVQALHQSYLDQYFKFCSNDMTTVCSVDTDCTAPATCVKKGASDGARAVALGSLAALAAGLAALIL